MNLSSRWLWFALMEKRLCKSHPASSGGGTSCQGKERPSSRGKPEGWRAHRNERGEAERVHQRGVRLNTYNRYHVALAGNDDTCGCRPENGNQAGCVWSTLPPCVPSEMTDEQADVDDSCHTIHGKELNRLGADRDARRRHTHVHAARHRLAWRWPRDTAAPAREGLAWRWPRDTAAP